VYKAIVELVRAMWATLPHPVPTFQDLLLCALRRHLIMALHTSHSEHLFRCGCDLGIVDLGIKDWVLHPEGGLTQSSEHGQLASTTKVSGMQQTAPSMAIISGRSRPTFMVQLGSRAQGECVPLESVLHSRQGEQVSPKITKAPQNKLQNARPQGHAPAKEASMQTHSTKAPQAIWSTHQQSARQSTQSSSPYKHHNCP
jgi:hypothetical protein